MKWPTLCVLALLSCALSACGNEDAEQDAAHGAGGAAGAPAEGAAAGTPPDVGPTCDPTGDGACQNDADCPIVDDGTATAAGQSCGLGCLADEARADCVTTCFVDTAHTTAECSACYGVLLDCVIGNCFTECATASDSQECVDCRTENGCDPEFRSCSGLPPSN